MSNPRRWNSRPSTHDESIGRNAQLSRIGKRPWNRWIQQVESKKCCAKIARWRFWTPDEKRRPAMNASARMCTLSQNGYGTYIRKNICITNIKTFQVFGGFSGNFLIFAPVRFLRNLTGKEAKKSGRCAGKLGWWPWLSEKNCLHFSICACHPCAGDMLIFSVSFQF